MDGSSADLPDVSGPSALPNAQDASDYLVRARHPWRSSDLLSLPTMGTGGYVVVIIHPSLSQSFARTVRQSWSSALMAAYLVVTMLLPPNHQSESAAVAAGCSAVEVHVANRRWLGFFR
jgi:hypothetical protein